MYEQEQAAKSLGYAQSNRIELAPPKATRPLPAGPTFARLAELRDRQNETHEIISRLESQLAPALAPEAVTATVNRLSGPDAVPSTSLLCEEIDSRTSSELHIALRLQTLIDRLTV